MGWENPPESGSKPTAIQLGDWRANVRKWNDVLTVTAEHLIASKRLPPLLRAPGSKRFLLKANNEGMTRGHRLSNGTFIETNWSAQDCVRRACQMVTAAGGELRDLQVW